ncbi:ATP-binding protein [Streptomyces sp. NPDC058463]|uniref:ATP-binding protein n=1 Tax=Streptomyces sp. NPDC058463 TaxID=3346510 RepID=UPI00365CA9A4
MVESPADTSDPACPPPLTASLVLSERGGSISEARHFAVGFLSKWRDQHKAEVTTDTLQITQLIVSELVTNARKYAPGPALLQLQAVGETLVVDVWDGDPLLPEVRGADPERIGQHGLEIVSALATTIDIRPAPPGKRVTAHIRLGTGAADEADDAP